MLEKTQKIVCHKNIKSQYCLWKKKSIILYLIVCQKEVKVQYVGEKQYCTLKKRQYVEKKMKRKEQYIMSTEKVIVQYVEQKVVALGV